MAANIHISIAAEPIAQVGGIAITNSMFTSLIVSAILLIFAAIVRTRLDYSTTKPSGLQNFAEWIVEMFYNLVHGITGESKRTSAFLPVVATFFLFIILNNWLGLFPGVGPIQVPLVHHEEQQLPHASTVIPTAVAAEPVVISADEPLTEGAGVTGVEEHADAEHKTQYVPLFRPGTADLNTTLALALFSVIATQVYGISFAHMGYLKKFFNFSSPIMFFVGILELASEFAKIISFAFRLFGNIFAGEVLLVVISFLVPLLVPIPFYGLEVFVGFIQALVFSMLSLVFFNMATQSHDH